MRWNKKLPSRSLLLLLDIFACSVKYRRGHAQTWAETAKLKIFTHRVQHSQHLRMSRPICITISILLLVLYYMYIDDKPTTNSPRALKKIQMAIISATGHRVRLVNVHCCKSMVVKSDMSATISYNSVVPVHSRMRRLLAVQMWLVGNAHRVTQQSDDVDIGLVYAVSTPANCILIELCRPRVPGGVLHTVVCCRLSTTTGKSLPTGILGAYAKFCRICIYMI